MNPNGSPRFRPEDHDLDYGQPHHWASGGYVSPGRPIAVEGCDYIVPASSIRVPPDDPSPARPPHVHPGPIEEPDGEHGDLPALIEAHNAAAARGDVRATKAAYMEIIRVRSRRGSAR